MSTDEVERSVRLVAAAALLALLARRRGHAPRISRTGFARTGAQDRRHNQDSGQTGEHDRGRIRGNLIWSALILLLLSVVVYTAIHSAEVVVELERLGLMPRAY